ncbi:putative mediator of RNA polymerase II transcription subunit [Nemania serpens]|nr:putative mediator of RNA polymerase II transcription subunit [Nemania serpens]
MAPMLNVDHDNLEKQLKDTIQSLYNIMVQVTYDATATAPTTSPAPATSTSTAPPTSPPSSTAPSSSSSREVLADELTALSRSLQTVHRTATTRALPHVPPELVQYVDNGRNPDVYTREFVELVRRGNQLMRGKQNAFAAFRDVLAGEIESAMPELRDDVARVLAATGGRGADNANSNANTNSVNSANANAGVGAGVGAEAKTTTGLDK